MAAAINTQALQTSTLVRPEATPGNPREAAQAEQQERPASGAERVAEEDTVELSVNATAAESNGTGLNQSPDRGLEASPQPPASVTAAEESVEAENVSEAQEAPSVSSSGRESQTAIEDAGTILNLIA